MEVMSSYLYVRYTQFVSVYWPFSFSSYQLKIDDIGTNIYTTIYIMNIYKAIYITIYIMTIYIYSNIYNYI